MNLFRRQSLESNVPLLAVLGLLCLALMLQGAHVCAPAESSGSGGGTSISLANPVCPVCARSQTLLVALIFVLFSLVPIRSRTLLVSLQPRPFRRALRLDMRAPPVL